MTAPRILATEQTTENTDHYMERVDGVESLIPAPVIVLLRSLQTQITEAEARITALENA